jgi:VWFA-related protein
MIIRMNIRKFSFLLLSAGLGLIAGPPSPSSSATQEAVQLQKPIQHEVTVTVKLVQVYVTDKKGKPVQDLQKSDFVVYDNGQKKEITEFEKHILAPPTSKAPPQPSEEKIVQTPLLPADKVTVMTRKFFLFFDFAFNNQKGVNKAKQAALHFIDTELSPVDEVGLLSYSMLKGISIHEFLTTNHRKVREALQSLDAKGIAGRAENVEEEYWRRAQEEGGGVYDRRDDLPIREARQESKNQAQNFILKLTALAKALRYVPGQKHFVLFSSGIPSSMIYGGQSGNPQGYYGVGQGAARNKLDPGDFVLRTQNEEMLKELSAANCTVFSFDTREAAMVPSLFTYDEQTFGTGGRDIFSTGGVSQAPVNVLKDDKGTGLYSITRLSKVTGGKYFSNIGEYEKNLDQVQTMTGTYYVLGYYISDQQDGSYHEIKVEVNKKGYEVRAQTGYFNPKPFREYSDLEKELHLFDLALTERPLLQTPLRFTMAPLSYAAGEETRLQILSKIPDAVIQKFSGKKVELISLVFDEKENLAGLQRAEADLTKYRGMDVFFMSGASLGPGPYKCRLVIRDLDTGNTAVASAQAYVVKKAYIGLSLHSPLLLVPESNFAYLEGAGARRKAGLAWNDAYPYDRARYSPMIGAAAQKTAKLFAVIPCSVTGIVLPNITLTAFLINSTSGEKIPMTLSVLNKSLKADIEIQFVEFPLSNVPPGKYLLYLHAEDVGTKYVSYAQTPLVIR